MAQAPPRSSLPDRPLSVEHIVKYAETSALDPQFSMQNWFRTADLMLKQASIYEHEGNDQMAYFLLYRHARIVLNDLPQHPQAKDPKYEQSWKEARKAVNRSLTKLETLKPRINKRYERHEARRAEAASATKANTGGPSYPSQAPVAGWDTDRQGAYKRVDTLENRDDAVRLANQEIRRRVTQGRLSGQASRQAQPDAQHESHRRGAPKKEQAHTTSQKYQSYNPDTARRARPQTQSSFNYPRVPQRSQPSPQNDEAPPKFPGYYDPDTTAHRPPAPPKIPEPPGHLERLERPDPPPKIHPYSSSSSYERPPTPPPRVPSKEALEPGTPPPGAFAPSTTPTPTATPDTPPPQFSSLAALENGQPLRTVFLPTPLRHAFARIAAPNTARNLETCGILCGTLIRNALFVTKLVIPEQTSTSDTCEMVNEEALYAFCAEQPEELMVLGWIHTHPSQTCFMSSRDLHTHVWYQVSLPESIAIVCAPSKDPDWGVFRLTDPPGTQTIQTCKLPGIFHPHSQDHIYTDALGSPGHVVVHEDLEYEVVDLRPKHQ